MQQQIAIFIKVKMTLVNNNYCGDGLVERRRSTAEIKQQSVAKQLLVVGYLLIELNGIILMMNDTTSQAAAICIKRKKTITYYKFTIL